jgi:hypothetical protein
MRWAGNVACMVENRDAFWVLVGRTEGKGCDHILRENTFFHNTRPMMSQLCDL